MSQSPQENFYDILGVHVTSNTDAIRKAWRLAAWANHPDLQVSDNAEERQRHEARMQQINEAYQTLSDPAKRRRYDLETGLLPATCGSCGAPGNLRLSSTGSVVALCGKCHHGRSRVVAL